MFVGVYRLFFVLFCGRSTLPEDASMVSAGAGRGNHLVGPVSIFDSEQRSYSKSRLALLNFGKAR